MKLSRIALVIYLGLITACAPIVDKQYANRQVAYIDIQPGSKIDLMQVSLLKNALQPSLIGALQGRGQPPAVGLTVRIVGIDLPRKGFGEAFFGSSPQSAYVRSEVELWDATTKAPLTRFLVGTSVSVNRKNPLGSVFGYPKGFAPEETSGAALYSKLGQALAKEIADNLYGGN